MFDFVVFSCVVWLVFCLGLAFAQPIPDATKLAPVYQQQRNAVFDGLAQCNVQLADLQARITELEKQLEEARK